MSRISFYILFYCCVDLLILFAVIAQPLPPLPQTPLCKNPHKLLQNPLSLFSNSSSDRILFPLVSSLTQIPPSSFLSECSNLDSVSCCDNHTIRFISQFFEVFDRRRIELVNIVNTFSDASSSGDADEQAMSILYSAVMEAPLPPTRGNATDKALMSLIRTLNIILPSIFPCYDSMVGYLQGMMCFACDPYYDRFMTSRTTDKYFTIFMNQTTCSGIYNQCENFFLNFLRILPNLASELSDFGNSLNLSDTTLNAMTIATDLMTSIVNVDMCSNAESVGSPLTNCQAFLCQDCVLFTAFQYDFTLLPRSFWPLQCWWFQIQYMLTENAIPGVAGLPNYCYSSCKSCTAFDDSTCNERVPENYVLKPRSFPSSYESPTDSISPESDELPIVAIPLAPNGFALTNFTNSSSFDVYSIGCGITTLSQYSCGRSPTSIFNRWVLISFVITMSVCLFALLCLFLYFCRKNHKLSKEHSKHSDDSLVSWLKAEKYYEAISINNQPQNSKRQFNRGANSNRRNSLYDRPSLAGSFQDDAFVNGESINRTPETEYLSDSLNELLIKTGTTKTVNPKSNFLSTKATKPRFT